MRTKSITITGTRTTTAQAPCTNLVHPDDDVQHARGDGAQAIDHEAELPSGLLDPDVQTSHPGLRERET